MKQWTVEFVLPSELKGITGLTVSMGMPGINFINLIRKPKIKKILNRI